jgi:hypothetical protein
MKLFLLLALLTVLALAEQRYDHHALIRIRLSQQTEFDKFFSIFPSDSLDVFSHDGGVSTQIDMDILFTPEQVTKLNLHYINKDVTFDKFQVLSNNYQNEIEIEKREIQRVTDELETKLIGVEDKDAVRYSDEEFYKRYHPLAEIHGYLARLQDKYPNMIAKVEIGKTIENRTLSVYHIHAPRDISVKGKPALWINAAQHCREWISPPVGLWAISNFLSGYSTNERIKSILDKIDIFYLPIVNEDGYVHTWGASRMHRKNKRVNSGGSLGVDLNRNWLSGFGGEGSSNVPSSEIYRGPHALSEPETKCISDFLKRHTQIKAGIDFHAYSQLNLRPWGKSRNPSPDETKLAALGKKMTDAIQSVHRINYQNIRSSGLYPASGIMCDEFYENHKMAGYTIELRPANQFGGGFALPPQWIIPTAQENFQAVLALAEYVRDGQ